jgi:hypothetical protein
VQSDTLVETLVVDESRRVVGVIAKVDGRSARSGPARRDPLGRRLHQQPRHGRALRAAAAEVPLPRRERRRRRPRHSHGPRRRRRRDPHGRRLHRAAVHGAEGILMRASS